MKIIGQAGSEKWLVEASKSELVYIMGYDSEYAMGDKAPRIEVGRTIPVSELWSATTISRRRKADAAKLANDLRMLAGRIDAANQKLAEPIVEVKAQ